MNEPTQDLSKFSHDNLLQFAKDSQANNVYQQAEIEKLKQQLVKWHIKAQKLASMASKEPQLYTFGESSTEVDYQDDHAFKRIKGNE